MGKKQAQIYSQGRAARLPRRGLPRPGAFGDEIVQNCPKLFYLQGESEGLDRLSLSNPRRAPAVLPSLQVTLNIQNIKSPLFLFSRLI